MRVRSLFVVVALSLCIGSLAGAQEQIAKPDQREWLRLIRNHRLDLILPSAMRDHDIDMWIHGTRQGDPDPLEYELGRTGGFIIFTDVGDRMRRDRDDLIIHPNHIFAFEYAVHTNLPDRPGYPISISFSNPQVVGPNGVEWIQVPNYGIYIIGGSS